MSYQKMNKQYKKKWLEALRSREYKQGQGALCSVDDSGKESFCCLGVLLDVAGGEFGDWIDLDPELNRWTFGSHDIEGFAEDTNLPYEIGREINLSSKAEQKLIEMNDGIGEKPKKFYQIANWIERNL